MNDKILSALARIEERYPITSTCQADQIDIDAKGVDGDFRLSVCEKTGAVFSDSWHEHFDDYEGLEPFLENLFSGKFQVVVEYRGESPIAHQLQMLEGDKIIVRSTTRSLVSPFWRKKSRKTLRYIVANKGMKTDQQ